MNVTASSLSYLLKDLFLRCHFLCGLAMVMAFMMLWDEIHSAHATTHAWLVSVLWFMFFLLCFNHL